MFLQGGTEDPGKRLVETGADRTEKRLDEVVGGIVTLAVDKLNEKLALRIGEFLHTWRILPLDVLLNLLHVLVLSLFVRQHLQKLACLNDDTVTLLGDRKHTFDIVNQTVISSALSSILKHRLRIDPDIVELHILDGISSLLHLAYLHHRHEGRIVHVNIHILGVDTFVADSLRHGYERKHK